MKRILFPAIAVVLFGTLLALVLWGPKGSKAKPSTAPPDQLIGIKYEDANQLVIAGPAYQLTLVKLKKDGADAWSIKQSKNVPAVSATQVLDTNKVTPIVTGLTPLSAKKKIAGGVTDFGQYGLTKPNWTIDLNNGAAVLEVGDQNAAAAGYYARLKGQTTVYLIDSSLIDQLPSTGQAWLKAAAND